MNRTLSRTLGVAALLFAAAVVTWRAWRFLTVDTCLDRGGSYDFALGVCDLATNHPVPIAYVELWLALAALAAVAGLWLLFAPRARET